jgi:uncharacterized protein YceH (UPF0502 family)
MVDRVEDETVVFRIGREVGLREERLSDLENDEGSEEAAVEESADDSAVDCSLREEVREVRAQLNDLFLENDDIRDRLNDL